jgi:hypothetical protein
VPGAARALTAADGLAERTDRALFVALTRGTHAQAGAGLTDAARWRLVSHARDLALGGALPDGASPLRREGED